MRGTTHEEIRNVIKSNFHHFYEKKIYLPYSIFDVYFYL